MEDNPKDVAQQEQCGCHVDEDEPWVAMGTGECGTATRDAGSDRYAS